MAASSQRVTVGDWIRGVPRALYWVLAVALVLRVAWSLYVQEEPSNFGDPIIYLNSARGIADGVGYRLFLSTYATAFHPIGYPGWLAGIVWVAKSVGLERHDTLLITLAQAVMGTASVALLYGIARRLFNDRTAIIAAALTACFPNLIFYSGLIYSETLYVFGLLLAVWIIVRADWNPVPPLPVVAVFGLVVGLTTLVRPFTLPLPLFLGIALLRAGARWAGVVRVVAIALGIAVLVLVPWTVRNSRAMHAFVPVSTNLGDTLCLDNSPGAYGGFRELPVECSPEFPGPTGEAKQNSFNLRVAMRWALHHPVDELELLPRRFWYGYRTDHDGVAEVASSRGGAVRPWARVPLVVLANLYYWVVAILGLFAVPKLWRDARRLFVLLVAASLAAVPLVLYGLVRFHVPLLPFLALGAAVTIDAILRRREAGAVTAPQSAYRRNKVI
jgi:4-amino-4-deoxy-L-arabinose transferase-like glycosyltransferase